MATKITDLKTHIANIQSEAVNLSAILEGLTVLNNEGLASNARFVMAEMALKAANEIAERLDSLNVPTGAIQ